MAKVDAYTCDECDVLVLEAEVTTTKTIIDGPIVQGEYERHACKDCFEVPEGVTLAPLKGRKTAKAAPPKDEDEALARKAREDASGP